MSPTTENARIVSADLTIGDHGVLSAWVHLDFGGSGQGFGGYVLGFPDKLEESGPYAAAFIIRTLEVAGVTKWSDLKGQIVRVRHTWSSVEAIGHALEDRWFCPADLFPTLRGVGR